MSASPRRLLPAALILQRIRVCKRSPGQAACRSVRSHSHPQLRHFRIDGHRCFHVECTRRRGLPRQQRRARIPRFTLGRNRRHDVETNSIIVILVIGLIAGWLAGKIMGGGFGLIGDIIIGVIGAFIGTWLWGVLICR